MAPVSRKFVFQQLGKTEVLKVIEKNKCDGFMGDPGVISLLEKNQEKRAAEVHTPKKFMPEPGTKNRGDFLNHNASPENPHKDKLLSIFDCANILRVFGRSRVKESAATGICDHSPLDPAGGDAQFIPFGEGVQSNKKLLRDKLTSPDVEAKLANEIKLKNIRVHLNGVTLPSSALNKKKYQAIAQVLLQKASLGMPILVLNSVQTDILVRDRITHVQDGNDSTNRKYVVVIPVKNKYFSSGIIKIPKNVTLETLGMAHQSSLDSLNTMVSSSTQTDNFKNSLNYFDDSEMANDSFTRKHEDKNYPKSEIVRLASKSVGMSSVSSFQSRHMNIQTKFSRVTCMDCREIGQENVDDTDCLSSTSDDDFDDDLGARFLSKIIKYSKGPDTSLVSPEIIITYSDKKCSLEQNLNFDSCEVCNGATYKYNIGNVKMSCESYFAEENNFRFRAHMENDYVNTPSENTDNLSVGKQRPPEISTGYSQLSYKEVESEQHFSGNESEFTADVKVPVLFDQLNGTILKKRFKIKSDIETDSKGSRKNYEGFCSNNQTECITEIGLGGIKVRFDSQAGSCGISCQELQYSQQSIGGEGQKQDKLNSKETPHGIHYNINYNSCGDCREEVLSQDGNDKDRTKGRSERIVQFPRDRIEQGGLEGFGRQISSSEEDLHYLYQRNLEVMKMNSKREDLWSSSSSALNRTNLSLNTKRYSVRPTGKPKTGPKRNNCSLM